MLLLSLLPLLHAADVLVFGDSWAQGSADVLQSVLSSHGTGLTVAGYGIGGTTCDQYANLYPTAIPATIALHPEARWVWLSMGGNDLFANYYVGLGGSNASLYNSNFRTVLDQIFAIRPDLKVVSFGYDFVNFEQSTECITTAWTYFGIGTLTSTINGYFLNDIDAVLQGIDPDYPNYTYVGSVWGTLQSAGGISTAPDANLPSPSQYMSDCIHPNTEGYTLIHEALYDEYWGQAAPDALISGSTTTCVGVAGTWIQGGSGGTTLSWAVDGVTVGADSTLSWTFDSAGEHTLSLTVDGGAWSDTDTMTVTTAAPPEVDVDGAIDAEAGEEVSYSVSVSDGGGVSWSIDGGTLVSDEGTTIVVRWAQSGSVTATTTGACPASDTLAVSVSAAEDSAPIQESTPISDSGTDETDEDTASPDKNDEAASCGCSSGVGMGWAWLGVAGVLMRRRTKQR